MNKLLASTALIALLTTGVAGVAHAQTAVATPTPPSVTAPSTPVAQPTASVAAPDSQKKSVDTNLNDKKDDSVKTGKSLGKTSQRTHHAGVTAQKVKATVPASTTKTAQ